jgi:phosphate transport system substrate-binding protein
MLKIAGGVGRSRPIAVRVITIGVALASIASACGGGGQSATDAPAPSLIAVDGSSTVFPISEAVAEEFQKKNPGTRITVGTSGTTGGFGKFCRGETVISDASRPISASEIDTCGKAGISYVELPVAYDGLTVVVNPKNTWAPSMTVTELRKMWSPEAQGKIMRWNQVRSGWPDKEIHLYGAGSDSGTFDYFTEVITGKARSSRGDYTSSEDDNILVQGVSGDEYALGYMGLAYYEHNKDKIKVVAVDDEKPDNGAGPIAPGFEAVRSGTYRPLSRPLFIYVATAALARPEVAQFVQFYVNADSALIREVGFVPLTDTEAQLVRQRFENKTAGTMFGGAVESHTTLESRLKGQ